MRYGHRKAKHTSMAMVSQSGQPAPSWKLNAEFTELANRCFRECLSPAAKPDLIRVYINSATSKLGRCWYDLYIITIAARGRDKLDTLAHEIAHLRFRSHGKRHAELTKQLHAWLIEHE